MLCQLCKQREATVHFTHIVNQQKVEMYVCAQCAEENSKLKIDINKLLSGFMGIDNIGVSYKPVICSGCGMSIEEFNRTGKLGCSKCYDVFNDSIQTMLTRIHGNVRHHGKIPVNVSGRIKKERELESLKSRLQQCIHDEDYEQAAQIRDQIKAIESSKVKEG